MTEESLPKRWDPLRKVLERPGPFCHPEFEPSPDVLEFVRNDCRVLVVGAGGLGCELLKDIALMGFRRIDVIDMDTIELSNLNRQFLFRQNDIGKPKATTAAAFVNNRVKGCEVTPHYKMLQDMDAKFYQQFHIIVCGLDSIVARRWVNGMLLSLLEYDENGTLDQSTIIPLIDGGTEGFKGSARVICPGMTACIDCTLDLYPPQITYPLCTIANTPRLPEHCIEYVKVIMWPKSNPFNCAIDGDDPQHIGWIFEQSTDRARQFNITGLTYRLCQGVVKNIIPAVASTNAVIAAVCATEVFKVATSCATTLKNYMVFNNVDGVYSYTFDLEKKDDCLACSQIPTVLPIADPTKMKLRDLIEVLCQSASFQMKNPGLTTTIAGKNKTLYMSTIKSIEERTRDNLDKTLIELGLTNQAEIMVADLTSPNTMVIRLKYENADVVMKE